MNDRSAIPALINISSQMFSQFSIRVQVPVMGDIQSGHRDAKRKMRVGFFNLQTHEDHLVAEVGRLLKLQIIFQKKVIRYRQDNLLNTLIFVFDAKAVFDKSDLRYDTKVPQLQNKIL
ncbi:MAG TPA: hypothetical protein VMG30_19000 [Acidobacteriota bacterium]|nr:hypothetical protein [Acidobacteriota bacterium]